MITDFLYRVCIFPPKLLSVLIALAASPKNREHFSAYPNAGLTNKHQLYLKSCGLRPGKSQIKVRLA